MKLERLALMMFLSVLMSLYAVVSSAQLPGENLKLKPEHLRFVYRTFDGTRAVGCRHEIYNAPAQDWKVVCGPKSYLVHLWVTVYRRDTEPKTSYEVLYWVTDLSVPQKPEYTGTTVWFHMKGEPTLHSLTVSQSVDNDVAGLYLDLVAP